MAYEVSRRNFLKGAAAMTVAAAASTLLAGCDGTGGSTPPAANEVVLGDYKVKVTTAKTTQETVAGKDDKLTGYITPVVSISYSGKGSPTFLYNEIFTSGTIGEAKMTLTNPLQPYNSIVGTFVSCEPKYKTTDKAAYLDYTGNKKPMTLKVSFDDKSYAVFEIWNNGTITASKV